jgi:O-antigen/teichoic acid export membrane protein
MLRRLYSVGWRQPVAAMDGWTRKLLARRLVRTALFSYGFTIATLVLNLVGGIIIARQLGPSGRGALAAIITVTQLAAWAGGMGANQAIAFRQAQHPKEGAVLLATWSVIMSPLAILTTAGAIGIIPTLFAAQSHTTVVMAELFALTIGLSMVLDMLCGFILGDHHFILYNAVRSIQLGGVTLIYVSLALLNVLTVRSALVANGFVAILLCGGSIIWALRTYGISKPNRWLARETYWYGFRVHPTNLSGLINARLDIAIMPAFLAAASIGLYSVATTIAAIVGTVAGTLVFLVLPAAARRKHDGARVTLGAAYATLAIGGGVALLIAAVAGPGIRIVFGPSFDKATGPLLILLPGYVLLQGASVLSAGISAVNRPFTAAIPQLLGSVVTVVGLLLFLRIGGIVAAACVTTSAYIIVFISSVVLYRKVTKIRWRALLPMNGRLKTSSPATIDA